MSDTKEKILQTALRLFAKEGYEAATVSTIAGELGITKGALYKHYKSKRDIFDSIVNRIYQSDRDRAKQFEVPEEVWDKTPSTYRNTSMDKIKFFMEEQFRFWTQDEFACNFRKMLTLEQYRNPEMGELYQKCLVAGPVSYTEDLFFEMIESGVLRKSDPKQLALEFYAPFYLLLSMDIATDKDDAADRLAEHIKRFVDNNIIQHMN